MVYRPHEFAKLVGKSTSTLRRWDRDKTLVASRGAGGQRYYTDTDLQKALNLGTSQPNGKTVVYDLMSVVHCFSCRLYGLRTYKKQIKKIAQMEKPD